MSKQIVAGWLVAGMALGVGCATYEEAEISCNTQVGEGMPSSDCPPEWYCHANHFCYASPEPPDAGDAGSDGGATDAGPMDAARVDSGPTDAYVADAPGADAGPDAEMDAFPGTDAGRDAFVSADAFGFDAPGADVRVPDAYVPDAYVPGDAGAGMDGGTDAAQDGGRDAGMDGGTDAAQDGGRDAGVDAGADAAQDGGRDAGVDAFTPPPLDACAPTDLTDPLDDLAQDTNCDGVDGVIGRTWYVAPGASMVADGSPGAPINLAQAISSLSELRPDIAVLGGTYNPPNIVLPALPAGRVVLQGSYMAGFRSRMLVPGASGRTALNFGASARPAITISSRFTPGTETPASATIVAFDINVAPGAAETVALPPGPSLGVVVDTAGSVVLRHLRVATGAGGAALTPAPPAGWTGRAPDGASATSRIGAGNGGNGGDWDERTGAQQRGLSGSGGVPCSTPGIGEPVTVCTGGTASPLDAMGVGCAGAIGGGGASQPDGWGMLSRGAWLPYPGLMGLDGGSGAVGAGGGGAASCAGPGGGGGGGGAGGRGGRGGRGGWGGGASIALYIARGSVAAADSTFQSGSGGAGVAGQAGRVGEPGGRGGSGAPATATSRPGGRGADGGAGGAGGCGAGGSGGSSAGVLRAAAGSFTATAVTILGGSGGPASTTRCAGAPGMGGSTVPLVVPTVRMCAPFNPSGGGGGLVLSPNVAVGMRFMGGGALDHVGALLRIDASNAGLGTVEARIFELTAAADQPDDLVTFNGGDLRATSAAVSLPLSASGLIPLRLTFPTGASLVSGRWYAVVLVLRGAGASWTVEADVSAEGCLGGADVGSHPFSVSGALGLQGSGAHLWVALR